MKALLLSAAALACFALGWRLRGEYERAGRLEPDEHERGGA